MSEKHNFSLICTCSSATAFFFPLNKRKLTSEESPYKVRPFLLLGLSTVFLPDFHHQKSLMSKDTLSVLKPLYWPSFGYASLGVSSVVVQVSGKKNLLSFSKRKIKRIPQFKFSQDQPFLPHLCLNLHGSKVFNGPLVFPSHIHFPTLIQNDPLIQM